MSQSLAPFRNFIVQTRKLSLQSISGRHFVWCETHISHDHQVLTAPCDEILFSVCYRLFSKWSSLRTWNTFQMMKTPQKSGLRRYGHSLERKMMVNSFVFVIFAFIVSTVSWRPQQDSLFCVMVTRQDWAMLLVTKLYPSCLQSQG